MDPFAISHERLRALQASLSVRLDPADPEINLFPDRFDCVSPETSPTAVASFPESHDRITLDRVGSSPYSAGFPGYPTHPKHVAFFQFFSVAAVSTMATLSVTPGSNWNPDEPISYNNWKKYTRRGFIDTDSDHWVFNGVIHPAVGAVTYLIYRPAGDLKDNLRNGLLPAAVYMVFTYAVAWEVIEAAAEEPSAGDVLANMSGILLAEAAWQASRNGLLHVTF